MIMASPMPESRTPWHPPCYGALDSFSVIRTEAARLQQESGRRPQPGFLNCISGPPEPLDIVAPPVICSLKDPSLLREENSHLPGNVEPSSPVSAGRADVQPWCNSGAGTGYGQESSGSANLKQQRITPEDQLDLRVLECKGDIVAAPSPVLRLLDYFNKQADLFETWEWEKMVDGVGFAEDSGPVPPRCLSDLRQRDFSCMIPYAAALHSELLITSNRNHRILQRLRNALLRDVRTAQDPTSDALVKGYYEQLEELVDIPQQVTFPPPSREGLLVTDCLEALDDVSPILRRRQKRSAQSDTSADLAPAIAELSTATGSERPQDSGGRGLETKGTGAPPVGGREGGAPHKGPGEKHSLMGKPGLPAAAAQKPNMIPKPPVNAGTAAGAVGGAKAATPGKKEGAGAAPTGGLAGKSIAGKGPSFPASAGATGSSPPPGKVSPGGADGAKGFKKPLEFSSAVKTPVVSSPGSGKSVLGSDPSATKKPVGSGPVVAKKPSESTEVAKKPLGGSPVVAKKPVGATLVGDKKPAVGATTMAATKPVASTPVAAEKPVGFTPAVAKKPVGGGPVGAKKPAGGSSAVAKEPVGFTPVVAKKPVVFTPVVAKKPVGFTPVVAKKPVGGSPVVAKKPAGGSPVVAKKPVGGSPAAAKKPVGGSPAAAKKPVGGSPVGAKTPVGGSPVGPKTPAGGSPVGAKKAAGSKADILKTPLGAPAGVPKKPLVVSPPAAKKLPG